MRNVGLGLVNGIGGIKGIIGIPGLNVESRIGRAADLIPETGR
jgi:hypothetical protein